MKPLIGNRFVTQWAEALNIEPDEVTRVVIDARVDDIVRVYVSKLGDEALLDIRPPSASEVRIVVAGEEVAP